MVLVDSNVLLDVMTEDPQWFEWSSDALARCADNSVLIINLYESVELYDNMPYNNCIFIVKGHLYEPLISAKD
jgi:hypothetical protein